MKTTYSLFFSTRNRAHGARVPEPTWAVVVDDDENDDDDDDFSTMPSYNEAKLK